MAAIFSKERLLEELDQCPEFERIDSNELADKLSILADIGKTPDGGVTRFPYTNVEKQAKSVFKEWMLEIGLDVREDAIGNLFGTLHGSSPDLPVVMTGSHLDSVPNGGAFDGPLGCLSSLLAIKAIASKQEKSKRSIELAVFVDEEGARFKNGIFGSRVMMGEVDAADFNSFKDDKGNVLYDEMVRCGHDPERVQGSYRKPEDIHAFLELHIEQGKRLESEKKDIGIVSGIAGPSWTSFTFIGETDHAGNTPMNFRRDTLAAAEFILKVEQAPGRFSQTAVATVGKINVFPNGTNVISGKTEVIVDARDIDLAARDAMISALKDEAMKLSKERGVAVDINDGINISPVIVPDHIQEVIRAAAEASGITSLSLPSGAGHDAMTLGKYVPSGMIFVPCLNGKSHSPEEWTSLPDCIRGVQVLKESLARLANS